MSHGAGAVLAAIDAVRLRHVLALALLARLVVWVLLPLPYLPDALSYQQAGADLLRDGLIADPYVMPLYPLVRAFAVGWAGTVVDILFSVGTVAMVHGLASEIGGGQGRAATLAALIAALFPTSLYYAVAGLSESMFTFLTMAALLALYRRNFLLGSVILVVSILTRATNDLVAPVLVATFALGVHGMGVRAAAVKALQYAVIYAVVMAPWWVHNYVKYDAFVRLIPADGLVLYVGNNPLNQTGGGILGFDEGQTTPDADVSQFARLAGDPMARRAAMRDAAIAYIVDNPGRFAELALLKLARMWRPWPYVAIYQSWAAIAAISLSFGPVALLAFGYVAARARREFWRLSPILGYTAYVTLVHMVTIASVRYRHPFEPLLMALAGCALAALAEALARRGGGSAAVS